MSGGRVPKAAAAALPTGDRYLDNTHAADPEFVVAVVDTGLVRQYGQVHDWLVGHVNDQDDNADPIAVPPDPLGFDDGHGTFVSGLILRQAPSASVRMIRAFGDGAPGEFDRLDTEIGEAILAQAQDPRVKVINLSFGGQIWESHPPEGIRRALDQAARKGVAVVAPAGNVPTGTEVWPAAFAYEFENVISVGAVDETATYLHGRPPPRASFSNYGYWVKAYAAGVNVLGPFVDHPADGTPFTGWARWSGTSFAAATVAGVIARVAKDNGLTALQAATDHVLSRRTHRIRESGWAAPSAYVHGVGSSWSFTPVTTAVDEQHGEA
jgi:hypothetical protein